MQLLLNEANVNVIKLYRLYIFKVSVCRMPKSARLMLLAQLIPLKQLCTYDLIKASCYFSWNRKQHIANTMHPQPVIGKLI